MQNPRFPRRSILTVTLTAAALALAPSTAPAQTACGSYYTIRTGDSLLEIAERCGVSIPALLAVNPSVRDREDLEAGARLAIPAPGMAEPAPQQACGGFYSVRTGDTLAEIAEKCGLTVPLLVAANPSLPDPLGVHVGLKVRIPNLPRRAVVAAETFVAEPVVAAAAPPSEAAPVDTAVEPPELTRLEGTLAQGDGCLILRTADGERIGLVGRLRAFGPGNRVVVLGVPADAGACGTARAIEVRIAHNPPD